MDWGAKVFRGYWISYVDYVVSLCGIYVLSIPKLSNLENWHCIFKKKSIFYLPNNSGSY